MSDIHLTINGQPVTAQSGQTILEAAQAAGIEIPTLCHHPALSNHGACRMCLVEVKGMRGLQTSCTCPAAPGMEVCTDNQQVVEGRIFSLQLLFSERNHYCMFCQMSGDCELQELAYQYGLDHWRYPRPYERFQIDASHPYIFVEPNRCILCTRCVRACAEIAASHTLGLGERGSRSMILADINAPLGESSCVSCGMCLQVCPTGALVDARSAYGGHAEDLTHTHTTCMQCSVGCALDVITRENRLLRVDGVLGSEPSGGLICEAGRFTPLYDQRSRITRPQVRQNGKLVEADWSDALELIARRLKSSTAQGLAACTTSNEALMSFAELLGNAGRLEPTPPDLGDIKKAQIQDLLEADLIVVAAPTETHRVIGYLIKRAADNGAQIILIGEAGNGLASTAALVVEHGDLSSVIKDASQAEKVVVLYGVNLKPETIRTLNQLAEKALFLPLDPAHNGMGAEAAGLKPTTIGKANMLYFLLGEQNENGALVDRVNGAFTVVQASYWSPLVEHADVVLPAPIWAERTGHFTNLEGRVLPLNPAVPMPDQVRDEAEVLSSLAKIL